MSGPVSTIAAFVTMTMACGTMVYSSFLLSRVRRRGQLDRLLARSIVDPDGRRVLLLGISSVNGTFLGSGLVYALATVGVVPAPFGDFLAACLFFSGSVAMMVQIRHGIRSADLTLENELELRDTHPEVFRTLASEAGGRSYGGTMLLALSAEGVRTVDPFERSAPAPHGRATFAAPPPTGPPR